MMENKRGKSGFFKLIISVCLFVILPGGFLTLNSQAAAKAEDITVSISYGYHNYGKGGRNLPVYFHLENSSANTFFGKVQVAVSQNEDENLLFEKTVELQGGEVRSEVVFASIPAGITQIYVKLYNDNGECLMGQPVSIRMNTDSSELFIGILTDKPEALAYFGNQKINDEGLLTKVFYFSAGDFPGQNGELDLLDVIVVSNFDTTTLSEEQMINLMAWMLDGGTLLLGIGDHPEKILDGFPRDLVDVQVGNLEMVKTDLGVAHFAVIEEDNYVEIPYREAGIAYGMPIFSSGGRSLIVKESKEKGNLAVAGFSFADIAAYCDENSSYVSSLLTQLISKERLRAINQEAIFGDYSLYWNIRNTVSMGNTDRLPNPHGYLLIITAYIFVIGPGLYFFFRRIDKRRYYGTAVIGIAVMTAALIYLMGIKTRFNKPFFIYSTIVEFEDRYVNEISYINLMAPTNDAYVLEVAGDYAVMPVARDSYYFPRESLNMTGDEEYSTTIKYGDNQTTITMENIPAFASKLFCLERKQKRQNYGLIDYEIVYFNGEVDGYVENQLGYDLEKAAVIMYGQVINIGDIKDGQRISLAGLEANLFPPGYTYHISRLISGNEESAAKDIKDSGYSQSLERAALLQHYLSDVFPEATMKARLVAFTTEQDQDNLTLQGDYEAHGITMVSLPVTINYRQESRIYFPRLIENPKVVMGNYLDGSNTIYGNEPVILEYQFNRNLAVESITFSYPDADDFNYFTPFSGSIYFYNYEMQRYDLISVTQETFSGRELAPYLTLNNTLRVRYEIAEDAEYRWDISLPVISFIGRDDYAED